jgi:Lon protease-like protein
MSPELFLPIFPLSVVLLPGTPMPLHIFEDRYKEMMSVVIPEHSEFGVVLVKDGGVVNIGCTATVEQVVRRYPDGRLDIICVGRRRFRIESIDDEKSYLRAAVEYFNDEDAQEIPPQVQQRAIAAYRRLREVEPDEADVEPRLDEPQLSFQLAQAIEDVDQRQMILSMRSELERLLFFTQALPDYINRRQQLALARRVAPRNGHAKHFKSDSH